MNRSTRILILGGVFLIVLVAGTSRFVSRGSSPVGQWLAPVPDPPQFLAQESDAYSGTISAEEIIVNPLLAGTVQALFVDEGDEVEAGQVLGQLDPGGLDEQIQSAEAELLAAQARLAEVQAGALPEEIQIAEAAVKAAQEAVASVEKTIAMARENVAAAQTALEAAQAELARLQAGPSSNDLALAETQLELARRRLEVAWSARDIVGGAEQRGEVPKGSYDAARAVVAEAEAQLQLVTLQVEKLKAGPSPKEIEAAEAQVDVARARVTAAQARLAGAERQRDAMMARLKQAQAQYDLAKAGATPEQIALAEAKVQQATAALRLLRLQRDHLSLRAPQAGVILARAIHVGEQVLPGSTLFRLANLERVRLTVYVPAPDLGRVFLGQPASVTLRAFPDRTFEGQVTYIASQAEFTPRNLQTKEERISQVYAVRIEVPNPDRTLKPGMPASVRLGGRG